MIGSSKKLALAFLAGALLVGAALGFTSAHVWAGYRDAHPPSREKLRTRLADALSLTPAQRLQLDTILERRHRDMGVVLDPVRPQMDSIRARARGEIERMLTPQQLTTYRDLQRRDSVARAERDSAEKATRETTPK